MEKEIEIKSLSDKIDSIVAKIEEKSSKEDTNSTELKSLKEELAISVKDHQDAIIAQKTQLDAIEAKLNKPSGYKKEKENIESVTEEEVKEVYKSLAKSLENKAVTKLEEIKSIRFTDATTTGGFLDTPKNMGSININAQYENPILSDVDFLPAVNANEGSVAWEGYDESLVDLLEANEMNATEISEAVKKSLIKLSMVERKAKMPISSRVIQNVLSGGNQINTLRDNFRALESRYRRILVSQVFKDIISGVNAGVIGKTASTTAEAPANAQAREDLRSFPTSLKVNYVNQSVLYVSRAFLNAIYSKEASDGHLPTEQFVTSSNGITSYVTPERSYPVRVFEHSQIGTYKSLANGTTDITVDYIAGDSNNTGKLLAFVGALKSAYKVVPSSVGTVGYDSSISNILDGVCPAGKVSFAAQGVVLREGIKTFYAS